MVACRDITSGESGCNFVTSNVLKSCSIKPFRDILAASNGNFNCVMEWIYDLTLTLNCLHVQVTRKTHQSLHLPFHKICLFIYGTGLILLHVILPWAIIMYRIYNYCRSAVSIFYRWKINISMMPKKRHWLSVIWSGIFFNDFLK